MKHGIKYPPYLRLYDARLPDPVLSQLDVSPLALPAQKLQDEYDKRAAAIAEIVGEQAAAELIEGMEGVL